MAAAMGNGEEIFAGGRRESARQNELPRPPPPRAQRIMAAAVSPQRLLQRAPSRRSVLGARAPLVDERDDDQASATRARGASAKLPCMATATDGALYVPY